jgi:hypothetical protein
MVGRTHEVILMRGSRVKSRLILAGLLVLFLLGACSSSSISASTSTQAAAPNPSQQVPEGWAVYGKPTDGFSLALPPEYQSYSTDPLEVDHTVVRLKDIDPQVAERLDWLKS